MKQLILATALTLIAAPVFAGDDAAEAVVDGKAVFGTWKTESGNALVEIKDCGDGTPCGNISHIFADDALTALDTKNPDPELAAQKILGSRILWGFKEKDTKWSRGRIYDSESGKEYKSKIQVQDDGTLEVKGCDGPFYKSQTWTKAEIPAAN